MGNAMTAGSILLAVALLLLVGLFILRPLLSPTGHRFSRISRRDALAMQKEALLATIRGLELEYETGKLPEQEFLQDRQRLMLQAADVLRELEQLETHGDDLDGRIEAAIASLRARVVTPAPAVAGVAPASVAASPRFCPQCGQAARDGDKFCRQCGTALG